MRECEIPGAKYSGLLVHKQ